TSSQARYAASARATYPGVWYERRMIREWSSDAPRVCPSSNCSRPITSPPARRASQYAAALPMPPRPSTAWARSMVTPASLRRVVPVVLEGGHGPVVVDPPFPLLHRTLPQGLGHGLHVRCHRAAARADVGHARVPSLPGERGHGLPGELQRIQR